MEIGKKFNTLSLKKYKYYIDHHKSYTDFNPLALYRSLLENDKLTVEEKIEVREYANTTFGKFFDFLQLKDPETYLQLITLGEDITTERYEQMFKDILKNQQVILKRKRIKHRNFGVYSKSTTSSHSNNTYMTRPSSNSFNKTIQHKKVRREGRAAILHALDEEDVDYSF